MRPQGGMMPVSSLSTRDLKAVLDIVHMVNDAQSETEMSRQVLAQLGALVGCDSINYSRVDLATGSLLNMIHEPDLVDYSFLPGYRAVTHQSPIFAAYRRGRFMLGTSVALSDCADLHTLRRLPVYIHYNLPYGADDQLFSLVHQAGQQGAALSINRMRLGFSDRDRAVVNLITPHLIQAVARRRRLASLSAAVRSLSRHAGQMHQARPRLSLLTSREREVVEHLVGGLTDRETARSLVISPRTVHKHLESIYRKLDIGNRTSLIALIHQTNDLISRTADDSLER
ncbi:MAG: response regulator transcription factor [Pseudonocardiaceae bacterium]